ncbi:MAG: hypothetical protein FJ317_07690 [SAR202 cluster bacterium]|nr:hypothetical protein [SAR202 cluster bacterium]
MEVIRFTGMPLLAAWMLLGLLLYACENPDMAEPTTAPQATNTPSVTICTPESLADNTKQTEILNTFMHAHADLLQSIPGLFGVGIGAVYDENGLRTDELGIVVMAVDNPDWIGTRYSIPEVIDGCTFQISYGGRGPQYP